MLLLTYSHSAHDEERGWDREKRTLTSLGLMM
jgi:hypothetical protein